MDSFVIRNFDSEKSLKYHHRFPRITDVFRYVEICVVVSALLWFFSTKLQFNLNFGFFLQSFQDVCQFLLSPRFVFVVGNAIVLTLFVKSGQFSGENSEENSSSSSSSSTGDVYDEFVKNSKKIRHEEPETCINQETPILNSDPTPETSTNQEASVLDSSAPPAATLPEGEEEEEDLEDQILTEKTVVKHLAKPAENNNSNAVTKTKNYKRSKSEYMKREKAAGRELRRSKTEKSKEEMSNEEFQRTIEDFIARQVKFIREESMAVVLQKQ